MVNGYGGLLQSCRAPGKVIIAKYGKEDHEWKSKEVRGPFEVGFLKEILKELEWVYKNWKFRIRDASNIRFWVDHWCGPLALSTTSPVLFELAINKLEIVAEVQVSLLDSERPLSS